jgi:hypothetical protein
VAGCYVLQPATGGAGLEPGALMALEVNDVGRLALGGQMGPEIVSIEGRLVSAQADEYEVSVKSVKLIQGANQVWNGERVRIKKEYVAHTYERKFSKSQTIALSTVVVAALYVVVTKQNLFGLGKGDPDKPPCDSTGGPQGPGSCTPAARFPRRP